MKPKHTSRGRAVEVPEPEEKSPTTNRRRWYIALLVTGVVLLAVSIFLVMSGLADNIERRVFALVNHAYLPGWVTEQIAEPIGNAVLGMAALVVVLLAVPKYRLIAWQYVVAGGLSFVAVVAIDYLVDRAQPISLEGYDAVVRAAHIGTSFPSVYVAILTAFGITVWPFVRWPWRIFILSLIIAEVWSRIFLGVHAPLDVVGGAAAAAIVASVTHLLPEKFRKVFRLSA